MKKIEQIIKKYTQEDIFISCDTFTEILYNILHFLNSNQIEQEDKQKLEDFLYENNIKRN